MWTVPSSACERQDTCRAAYFSSQRCLSNNHSTLCIGLATPVNSFKVCNAVYTAETSCLRVFASLQPRIYFAHRQCTIWSGMCSNNGHTLSAKAACSNNPQIIALMHKYATRHRYVAEPVLTATALQTDIFNEKQAECSSPYLLSTGDSATPGSFTRALPPHAEFRMSAGDWVGNLWRPPMALFMVDSSATPLPYSY